MTISVLPRPMKYKGNLILLFASPENQYWRVWTHFAWSPHIFGASKNIPVFLSLMIDYELRGQLYRLLIIQDVTLKHTYRYLKLQKYSREILSIYECQPICRIPLYDIIDLAIQGILIWIIQYFPTQRWLNSAFMMTLTFWSEGQCSLRNMKSDIRRM